MHIARMQPNAQLCVVSVDINSVCKLVSIQFKCGQALKFYEMEVFGLFEHVVITLTTECLPSSTMNR